MIKIINRTVLIIFAVFTTACATFEIEGKGSITPDSMRGSETIHGSLYGFKWSEFSVEKCEQGSLFRVEHHTNALLLLSSIVTLGLYVPQTVEWWCDGASLNDDSEEEWVPEVVDDTEI